MIKKLLKILFICLLSFTLPSYLQAQSSIWLKKFRNHSLEDSVRLKYLIKYLLSSYNYDSTFEKLNDSAKNLFAKTEIDSFYHGVYYNAVGKYYYFTDNIDTARKLLKKAIRIFKRSKSRKFEAISYGNLGNTYYEEGNLVNGLQYMLKALDIFYQIQDSVHLAISELNIGNVYLELSDTTEALKRYQRAYSLEKQLGYTNVLANISLNLAILYFHKKQYDSSLFYTKLTVKYAKQSKYYRILASAYRNLFEIYINTNKLDSALFYLKKAEKIILSIKNLNNLILAYNSYSRYYRKTGNLKKAKEYALKSLKLINETKLTDHLKEIYYSLFKIDSLQGNYKEALYYHVKLKHLEDSLNKADVRMQIANLQAKFDLQLKEKENALLKEKQIQQEKIIRRQKTILFLSIILLFTLAAFFISLFKSNKVIRKINQELKLQNQILNQQKEEIKLQKEIIEEHRNTLIKQKKDLTDSIIYASYIQKTLFPNIDQIFKDFFKEWFLFFKPQNIVSGDFYWAKKLPENKLFLIVGDCTGHGVPGALMSVMTITLIKEFISQVENFTAAEALNFGREKIKKAMSSSQLSTTVLHGLDAAVIIFDKNNKTLNFAGAFRPLYIIRNNELIELEGDKQPIATYFKEKKFTDKYVEILPNDMIYLFTDGFTGIFSQLYGKFTRGKFKKFLLEINTLSAKKQLSKIEEMIKNWMGNEQQYDDITILGMRA